MAKKDNKEQIFSLSNATTTYRDLLNQECQNEDYLALLNSVNEGENYISQTSRSEIKTFDDDFINELVEGVGAIMNILINPRTFIKEEQELVQTELAKKVSTLSLRYFASHTQYLSDIDEDDNVIPSKILTIFTETDLAIYENRFIMTLIKRVIHFIQTRYDWIVEHKETTDSDLLLVHNKTVIDGVTYEVDARIKASTPSLDDGNSKKNEETLQKLSELKKNTASLMHSPFMEQMRGAKEVTSPIHMTNMLRKHPDYHQAYLLWNFLDQYEELGISYDVKETAQQFDKRYLNELNKYVANSVILLHNNRVKDKIPVTQKVKYEPQIIFKLEDVTYADSKFLYDAYPEAKASPANPLPPTPQEVRESEIRFKENMKHQKALQKSIAKSILEEKDRICLEEANERQELLDKYQAIVKEIEKLKEENARLKAKKKAKKKK